MVGPVIFALLPPPPTGPTLEDEIETIVNGNENKNLDISKLFDKLLLYDYKNKQTNQWIKNY